MKKLMVSVLMVILLCSFVPKGLTFIVISESEIEEPSLLGIPDLTLTLSGSYGMSREGTSWNKIELEAGYPLGPIDLSGSLTLASYQKSVRIGASLYSQVISLGSDLTWFLYPSIDPVASFHTGLRLGPIGLSGNTTFNLRSRSLGDPELGASLQLGSITLSAGASYSLSSKLLRNPHAAMSMQMGPLALLASANEFGGSYTGNVGVNLAFQSTNLSLNTDLEMSGLGGEVRRMRDRLGIDLRGRALSVSGLLLHDSTTGYSAEFTGELQLKKLSLSATVRVDPSSYDVSTTIEPQIGRLTPFLTVGFDKEGYKWLELGAVVFL